MEKCVKNSAVKSALNCFYNFENFRKFFNDNNNKDILLISKTSDNNFLEDNKTQMGYSVFDSIQSLSGNDESQINSNLFDLRKNMGNYGLDIKYNEEIQIGKFIFYFLKILNGIFNEVVININNPKKIDKELKYLSSDFTFENGQEEQILNKMMEVYNKRILSLILRNFINIIKTKKKCVNLSKDPKYQGSKNGPEYDCMLCGKESNSFLRYSFLFSLLFSNIRTSFLIFYIKNRLNLILSIYC